MDGTRAFKAEFKAMIFLQLLNLLCSKAASCCENQAWELRTTPVVSGTQASFWGPLAA